MRLLGLILAGLVAVVAFVLIGRVDPAYAQCGGPDRADPSCQTGNMGPNKTPTPEPTKTPARTPRSGADRRKMCYSVRWRGAALPAETAPLR